MSDVESSSSEGSSDESEVLVYVELDGCIDSNVFKNEKLQFHMVGIDSDNPVMEVNGKFYEGTYEDAVGTYMFFERDNSGTVDDPIFDTPATWKYFAKTRKLLKMERVFAVPRIDILGDSGSTDCIPNVEMIKQAGVPLHYQDDALNLWIKMRDDRMKALNEYLEKQQIREAKRLEGIQLDSESDEDNPFAMYKLENKVSELKSSSKDESVDKTTTDSEPMAIEATEREDSSLMEQNDSASEEGSNRESTSPSSTVTPRSKSPNKEIFKRPGRRAPRNKRSPSPSSSSVDLKEAVESPSSDSRTELTPVDSVTEQGDKLSLAPNDGEAVVLCADDKDPSAMSPKSKKMEKQAKREAKMSEISNKLKTHKDELLKLKNPGTKKS